MDAEVAVAFHDLAQSLLCSILPSASLTCVSVGAAGPSTCIYSMCTELVWVFTMFLVGHFFVFAHAAFFSRFSDRKTLSPRVVRATGLSA